MTEATTRVVEAAKVWAATNRAVNDSGRLGPSEADRRRRVAAIDAVMRAEDELMAAVAALEHDDEYPEVSR
ncbi:MAG: hypothetical protein ACYC5Y_05060 [Symbiobacteriia bacterium]